MATAKFHVPIEVAGPTGATAATRYAGGTASGAPASGTFAKGDFVIDQTGKIWVCTTAGSPGTWTQAGGGGGGGGAGSSSLVYRYTIVGSDKTSIDTGVDTADAGSTDWTNGDLLEIFCYARTDEAAELSQVNCTFNNDTGANYDVIRSGGQNASSSTANSRGRNNFFADAMGASAAAGVFASLAMAFPNYAGTVGHKPGTMMAGSPSQVAVSIEIEPWAINYRSTSAVTRFAVTPNTAGKKLKIGSQVLIHKRLAS